MFLATMPKHPARTPYLFCSIEFQKLLWVLAAISRSLCANLRQSSLHVEKNAPFVQEFGCGNESPSKAKQNDMLTVVQHRLVLAIVAVHPQRTSS